MSNKTKKESSAIAARCSKVEKELILEATKILGLKNYSSLVLTASLAMSKHVIETHLKDKPIPKKVIDEFNKGIKIKKIGKGDVNNTF